MVLARLGRIDGRCLDLACGVGLTSLPLVEAGVEVYGIDFNATACVGAARNGIRVCRGEGTALPFADRSFAAVLVSELLQYLTDAQVEAMVVEVARVLAPGGRGVIVWRNGRAAIHRMARPVYQTFDLLRGRSPVHLRTPHPELVGRAARATGLATAEFGTISALTRQYFAAPDGLASRCLGAAYMMVLTKPEASARQ